MHRNEEEESKYEQDLREEEEDGEKREERQLPLHAALWQTDNVMFVFVRLSASNSLVILSESVLVYIFIGVSLLERAEQQQQHLCVTLNCFSSFHLSIPLLLLSFPLFSFTSPCLIPSYSLYHPHIFSFLSSPLQMASFVCRQASLFLSI